MTTSFPENCNYDIIYLMNKNTYRITGFDGEKPSSAELTKFIFVGRSQSKVLITIY